MGITPVPFAPAYGVTPNGCVFSRLRTGPGGNRMRDDWALKTPYLRGAYRFVNLIVKGKRTAFSVHRLVVTVLLGPIPKGLQVNHIDGNKQNNAVANLEIVTPKGNMAHAIVTGLRHTSGENHPMAKLTRLDVEKIRALSATHRQRDIASTFGVNQGTIWRIIHGHTWK